MKKLLFAIALFILGASQQSFGQNLKDKSTLPPLLNLYFNVKDALVAGNASDAAESAASFVKTANSIDDKLIAKDKIEALVKDAGNISDTKDIAKQREYFLQFSNDMTTLAKSTRLSNEPVYVAYCPMKKASWLSNEKAIKNPYYGNSMLTCGKVTETIKQ